MTNKNDDLSQFRGTTIDSIKEVANEKGERKKGSSRFYQLPEGKSTVRFLANPVQGKPFFHEAAYHWIGNEKVYCRKSIDKCPVCLYASRIWQQHESAVEEGNSERAVNLKKQAMDLFAKNEYYYNVVVRKANGADDKVAVLQTGVSVKKDVTKLWFDEDYGDVTDVEKGHDIVIAKSGKGKETRYSTTPRPQKSFLAGGPENRAEAFKLISEIYEQRRNLVELVTFLSVKELDEIVKNYEHALENTAADEQEDDSSDTEAPEAAADTAEFDEKLENQMGDINAALEKVKAGRS